MLCYKKGGGLEQSANLLEIRHRDKERHRAYLIRVATLLPEKKRTKGNFLCAIMMDENERIMMTSEE